MIQKLLRSPASQWVRHLVQLTVLLCIVAVPVLAHYRAFLADHKIETIREQTQDSLPRSVILEVDEFLRGSEQPATEEDFNRQRNALLARIERIRGNTWSADIYGVTLTDPLAGAESIAAAKRVTGYLLLGLLIPVVATVIFGRFFCSWICPAGFLLDMADKIRALLERMKVPAAHVNLWRGNKFVLLAAGLALVIVFGIPLLGLFYPPALVGREINAVVTGFFAGLAEDPPAPWALTLSGASLFLFVIAAFEVFVARRAWCRTLCPGGALYIALGAARIVRVANDRPRCTRCTACIQVCPMGLNPMHGTTPGPECDQCLACLKACPPASLAMEFSLPFARRKHASAANT